jgi:hypothetical protein
VTVAVVTGVFTVLAQLLAVVPVSWTMPLPQRVRRRPTLLADDPVTHPA